MAIKLINKHFLRIGLTLLAVIIFVIFSSQLLHSLRVPSYGSLGIFHYYLGAKYLREIGYFNLYSCAVDKNNPIWRETKLVRDLKTYKLVRKDELSLCPRNNFTNQRLKSFLADSEFITIHAEDKYWSYVVTDKGFNPPPSWASIAGTLANIIPLETKIGYFLLFNFDLLFILIAAVIIWYELGIVASLITLFLSLIYFGTLGALGNNYLQYGWYPLIVASYASWRRKKYNISGIALGFATALQMFPLFFAIPVGCWAFVCWIRQRRAQFLSALIFLRSFAIACFVFFLIGSFYAGGVSIWKEWYSKINIHKNYLTGEIFNIGLPNFIATIVSSNHENAETYIEDYSHTQARNEVFRKYNVVWYLFVFLGLSFIFFVLWRSKHNQPILFGYFLIYLLVTLSPYYYLVLSLIPFMFWNISSQMRRFSIFGTLVLFLLQLVVFWGKGNISFHYTANLISEIMIFIFLSLLILLLFFSPQFRKNKEFK